MSVEETRRIVDRLQNGFGQAPLDAGTHDQPFRDVKYVDPIPPEMIERVAGAMQDADYTYGSECPPYRDMAAAAIRAVRAWDYGK